VARYHWLSVAAIPAAAFLLFLLLRRRKISPEERERKRRLAVNTSGRITDAVIMEVRVLQMPSGALAHFMDYNYDLHGVTYSATQDITALLEHIQRDPQRIAGPASVKYLPSNPSNSILICEEWSGLR